MGRLLRYMLLVATVVVASTMEGQAQRWAKKLHFEGFAKATHISTSGMNLWVSIDNDSVWRYEIKSCEIDVAIDGSHLATISLRNKVVIPRRYEGDILLPLRFESRSSFALGRLLQRAMQGESERITISYRVRAGGRVITKRFEQSDIRLSDIIDSSTQGMTTIEELWQLVK